MGLRKPLRRRPTHVRRRCVGGLQFPEPCVYLDDQRLLLHRLSTIWIGLAPRMKRIADSRYLGDDHQNQIELCRDCYPSCTELTFLDCELLAY